MSTQDTNSSEKDDQYYDALVRAWIDTRMERDRSILNISAGGIALLITLLTTVGPRSPWQLLLYLFSGVCFTSAVLISIHIFGLNAKYIKALIKNTSNDISSSLRCWDLLLVISFIVGIILFAIIAYSSAYFTISGNGR